jgi:hypothetical protein
MGGVRKAGKKSLRKTAQLSRIRASAIAASEKIEQNAEIDIWEKNLVPAQGTRKRGSLDLDQPLWFDQGFFL